jgi:hypothetical protein
MIIKYMGIIVASHLMKKRKRSWAIKTTSMAPSTSRIRIMKARTCVVTELQEQRMHKGERRVVRSTRRMLIPSTPTAYSMLKVGIHGIRSGN